MADDSKNVKLSKINADCDKIKVNKTESYDSNGKRVDSTGLNEPVKKKQKRPRDEKSGDSGSSLSSSVSITPIASLQSSVSTSLSNTGLFYSNIYHRQVNMIENLFILALSTTASSSGSSNLSSVLSGSSQDHWPQQHQQQVIQFFVNIHIHVCIC